VQALTIRRLLPTRPKPTGQPGNKEGTTPCPPDSPAAS
jgi:hypothetical protein